MNNIVFFPTSCLEKLDKLHINYTVNAADADRGLVSASYDAHSAFCTVTVADEDYDRVYQIGRDEHSRMLAAAYGHQLDKE